MKIKKYIDNYIKDYKNFKDYWNYEDGCVLTGCIQMYEVTGDAGYRDFVFRYLEDVISEDGTIISYDNGKHSIDSFNSGRALLFAYEQTSGEKYRKAIEFLLGKINNYPRTSEGNFIHKSIYPDQVWLDGLYMVQPFYAYCIKNFGSEKYDDVLEQFRNVRDKMFCPEKNLYCHGYDSARVQPWADKKSGLSESFWLRAIGWYMMALVDTADIIDDKDDDCYKLLRDLFCEAAAGLKEYADKNTGLFYQVVDMGDDERNYTETSGSLMIAYALMKGAHMGFSDFEQYSSAGRRIFGNIIEEKLKNTETGWSLTDICCSAGLGPGNDRNGSAEYYFSERIVSDDPKGAGALMMAYSRFLADEMLRQEKMS